MQQFIILWSSMGIGSLCQELSHFPPCKDNSSSEDTCYISALSFNVIRHLVKLVIIILMVGHGEFYIMCVILMKQLHFVNGVQESRLQEVLAVFSRFHNNMINLLDCLNLDCYLLSLVLTVIIRYNMQYNLFDSCSIVNCHKQMRCL